VIAEGRLFCPAGSPLVPLVDALAWLWRLGPRRESPAPTAVGLGEIADAAELDDLVRARRLAGAVLLAAEAGEEHGPVPARRVCPGVARIDDVRIEGVHTLFADDQAVVHSSLGVHAVRRGNLLVLGAEPSLWGRLDLFWVLKATASFLVERLERPLVLLPPVGCLRLDDFPGTAELQLRGRARGDRRQRRRAETVISRLQESGAQLVVAVAARALDDDGEAPLDQVWPSAVAALRRGIARGVLEPACHGLLHLNQHARAGGRLDPREFAELDVREAGLRLDAACVWLRNHLGEPGSFIAPAWEYGPGALAAAVARKLPTWLPPAPGPLLSGYELRETLAVGLPGLHRIDYEPLRRLASLGLPPIVVFHGRLLDDRLTRLRANRDFVTAARLALQPDLLRVARVSGVRWVGVQELVKHLRAHGSIDVDGAEVQLPSADASARLFRG
jgi:hypothetical protein